MMKKKRKMKTKKYPPVFIILTILYLTVFLQSLGEVIKIPINWRVLIFCLNIAILWALTERYKKEYHWLMNKVVKELPRPYYTATDYIYKSLIIIYAVVGFLYMILMFLYSHMRELLNAFLLITITVITTMYISASESMIRLQAKGNNEKIYKYKLQSDVDVIKVMSVFIVIIISSFYIFSNVYIAYFDSRTIIDKDKTKYYIKDNGKELDTKQSKIVTKEGKVYHLKEEKKKH